MTKPFYAELPFLGPTTAASVAAAIGPGPTDGKWVYVDEFDATYRWHAGDVTAVDNFRVLGHTGGIAGRWILDGTEITLAPLGGILDDWARLGLAMAAMAYQGRIKLAAGTWLCATPQVTPSGTILEMSPGVSIVSSLVPNPPSFSGSVFYNDGGTTAVDLTTLGVDAVVGSRDITVASSAGINIGDRIVIRNGVLWVCSRLVINKVGNVLSLDRPILRPYVATNGVAVVPMSRDIKIYGNGAQVTGTGDAAVELVAGWNCLVEDLHADMTTQFLFVFDAGSRDSVFRRCSGDGNLTAESAFQLDSVENCVVDTCNSIRVTNSNIVFSSDDNCHVIDGIHSESSINGMILSILNAADVVGCRGCTVRGTAFLQATGVGVLVQNGSSDNTFEGVESSFNAIGFSFTGGTAPAMQNTVLGARCRFNTQADVFSSAAALRNRIIGLTSEAAVIRVGEITSGAEIDFVDCAINDNSATGAIGGMLHVTGAGSVLRAHGIVAVSTRNASHLFEVDATAKLFVDGPTRFTGSAANNAGVFVSSGVARISGMVVAAGAFGLFLNGAAAFARIADDVDFSAAVTPFNIAAGNMNRGRVALTAAVPVAIAFGDTNATDDFYWSYETNVGATGIVISGAPIVGTGFNIVGIAGDTSFINYEIR